MLLRGNKSYKVLLKKIFYPMSSFYRDTKELGL